MVRNAWRGKRHEIAGANFVVRAVDARNASPWRDVDPFLFHPVRVIDERLLAGRKARQIHARSFEPSGFPHLIARHFGAWIPRDARTFANAWLYRPRAVSTGSGVYLAWSGCPCGSERAKRIRRMLHRRRDTSEELARAASGGQPLQQCISGAVRELLPRPLHGPRLTGELTRRAAPAAPAPPGTRSLSCIEAVARRRSSAARRGNLGERRMARARAAFPARHRAGCASQRPRAESVRVATSNYRPTTRRPCSHSLRRMDPSSANAGRHRCHQSARHRACLAARLPGFSARPTLQGTGPR